VKLKTEADGRVFPLSNSSQSIYDCLYRAAEKAGVHILRKHKLLQFQPTNKGWQLQFSDKKSLADYLVICSGGNSSLWAELEKLGHHIVPPVPSLFTFKSTDADLQALSGISLNESIIHYRNNSSRGPLLLTHQGISGPATLKLSAWEARNLADSNYRFRCTIQWNANATRAALQDDFFHKMQTGLKEKVSLWKGHGLPKRLWSHLLVKARISEYTNWSEIGKKGIQRLCDVLLAYPLEVQGKSTFKEEFVTAGGVDLQEVNLERFESKRLPGLFLAGEILNIDAVTGGFNFQAAWSGAYLISHAI
jgi:predicted Rossmann fold flavoprotein